MSTMMVTGNTKLYKPVIMYWSFLILTSIFIATILVDFIFQLNGMTPLVVNPPDGRSPFVYLVCLTLSFLMFSIICYMIFKERAYEIDIFIPMNKCKIIEHKNCYQLLYNDNMFRFTDEKIMKKIKELKWLKFTVEYNIFGKYIGTYLGVRSQI